MNIKKLTQKHNLALTLLKGIRYYTLLLNRYTEKLIECDEPGDKFDKMFYDYYKGIVNDYTVNLNWFEKRYKNLVSELNLIETLNEIEKEF